MREYELSEEQLQRLLDAAEATPYIVVGGTEPPSAQDNADAVWQSIAREMGFVWDTVEPAPGKGQRFIVAEEAQQALAGQAERPGPEEKA